MLLVAATLLGLLLILLLFICSSQLVTPRVKAGLFVCLSVCLYVWYCMVFSLFVIVIVPNLCR